MAQDHLRVLGMIFHAYHGLAHEEIKNGQRFEVDVEIRFDASPSGRSDHIQDTIDVRQIYTLVHSVVVEGRFFLIEAVAEHIAAGILNRFPVETVTVRVRKPFAPLGGLANGTEIEIIRYPSAEKERSRPD
jgi:dihydroneopterin aldolase